MAGTLTLHTATWLGTVLEPVLITAEPPHLSACATVFPAPVTSVIPMTNVAGVASMRAAPRAGGGHLPGRTLPGQCPVGQPSAPPALAGGRRQADVDNLEPIFPRPGIAGLIIRRLD